VFFTHFDFPVHWSGKRQVEIREEESQLQRDRDSEGENKAQSSRFPLNRVEMGRELKFGISGVVCIAEK